jgi:hypothetical protein
MLIHEIAELDQDKAAEVLEALTGRAPRPDVLEHPENVVRALLQPIRAGLGAAPGRVGETLRTRLVQTADSIGLDKHPFGMGTTDRGPMAEDFDVLSDRSLAWGIAEAAFNEVEPILMRDGGPISPAAVGSRILARSRPDQLVFMERINLLKQGESADVGDLRSRASAALENSSVEIEECELDSLSSIIGWAAFAALDGYHDLPRPHAKPGAVLATAPVVAEFLAVWTFDTAASKAAKGKSPTLARAPRSAPKPLTAERTRTRKARALRTIAILVTATYFYLDRDETWDWLR